MKWALGIALILASASVVATAFWRDGDSAADGRLNQIHETASF